MRQRVTAIIIVIIVSLIVAGCVTVTPSAAPLPAGRTECATAVDGSAVPLMWVRVDVLLHSSGAGIDVLAHELSHGEDVKRFPSCEAFHRWLNEPGHWAESEARAFCAQARANATRRGLAEPEFGTYAESLSGSPLYDGLALTRDSAEALIRGACSAPGG